MVRAMVAWAMVALCLALAGPAAAQCQGRNLIDDLPADQRAGLAAAVALHPYASGNLWHAEKPGASMDLVGTLHLYDPRMDPVMGQIGPLIDAADLVLVEAGRDEVAMLQKAAASQPDLLFRPDGPTLPEQLTKTEWKSLSAELSARGVPPFLGSRFQPWYVSVLLAVPVCAAAQLAEGSSGLDDLIMRRAETAGVPIRALEPYDTAFRLFATLGEPDQIDMLRTAMAMAPQADDQFATLLDSYFAGQHREIWEFARMQASAVPGTDPAKAAAEFTRMEQALLTGRTVPWMQVLLPAATGKRLVVAVGAAHLSGELGLLNLLARVGWSVTPLSR